MAVIRIDPGEVETTGGKFIDMQSQVEGLVSQARTMMDTLQSQFLGARAKKIFDQWGGMQSSLTSAINTLQEAGTLLNNAAKDFREVDKL